jgi:hypothetical protein
MKRVWKGHLFHLLAEHYSLTCVASFQRNCIKWRSTVGRTPACVKTSNSQDTMSAAWRKERSTVETNEVMKTAAQRPESWCWRQLLSLLSHILMLVWTQLVYGRPKAKAVSMKSVSLFLKILNGIRYNSVAGNLYLTQCGKYRPSLVRISRMLSLLGPKEVLRSKIIILKEACSE